MPMKHSIRLALVPLLLGSATAAYAEEQPALPPPPDAQAPPPDAAPPPAEAQPAEAPAPNPNDGKWHFATIGYIWFAGAWGTTDINRVLPPVELNLPFGKVLKAFKFAFMGAAEARHDRFVILGDLTWIHLGGSEGFGVRDPDFLKVRVNSKTSEITLLGGYRVVDNGPVSVDLLAGGRMNWFDTSVKLEGPNREAEGSTKENWFDPLIGTRIAAPLGGKWSFSFYGDLGGIVTGSKITWQAVPTINYQINHKMTVGAGWRYYKVDRRNGDFLYNVHQSGPMITLRSVL